MENDTTNTYMERMKLNKNSELKAANKAQRKKKTEERRNKRRKNIFGRGGGELHLGVSVSGQRRAMSGQSIGTGTINKSDFADNQY